MENCVESFTNEEREVVMAQNEERFSNEALAQEILPLVREYFWGRFQIRENAVLCSFLNGQVFCVTVKEVV